VKLHAKGSTKTAEEVGDKLQAAVQGNMSGYSMLKEDMDYKKAG